MGSNKNSTNPGGGTVTSIPKDVLTNVRRAARLMDDAERKLTRRRLELGREVEARPKGVSVRALAAALQGSRGCSAGNLSRCAVLWADYVAPLPEDRHEERIGTLEQLSYDLLHAWRPSYTGRGADETVALLMERMESDEPLTAPTVADAAPDSTLARKAAANGGSAPKRSGQKRSAERAAAREAPAKAGESPAKGDDATPVPDAASDGHGRTVRVTLPVGLVNRLRTMRAEGESLADVVQRLLDAHAPSGHARRSTTSKRSTDTAPRS